MVDPTESRSTEAPRLTGPALAREVFWALRHRGKRCIRGQRFGEQAEQAWRESEQRNETQVIESASGWRKRLERFVAHERTMAQGERVMFQRRRVGWEEMVERELLRRVWHYFRPYKWEVVLLLTHIFIAVAVGVGTPWVGKVILDAGILAGDMSVAMLCVAVLTVMLVLGSMNMRAYNRRSYAVSHRVIANFRTDANAAIERLHPLQFAEVEAQQVATLTQENVAAILQLLGSSVLRTVVGVAVAIVLLFVLLLIDWRIAALGAAALPINTMLQIRYRWRFRGAWHRVNEYYYHIKDLVTERVEHHEVYRAFGIHEQAARDTDRFIEQNRNASVRRDWIMADWNFFIELTGHLCNVAIMALTAWMAVRGEITPGMFMMLVLISAQLYRPILDAYGVLMSLQGSLARVSDTLDFIDRDKENVYTPLSSSRHPKKLCGDISVEGVGFSYRPEVPILREVDLHIAAGRHVGLIGRTGSGKTTLFRLIAREYEPDIGTIHFDGYDYKDLDINWFRSTQLAVVLQDPHIINSRIGAIIRMGCPDASYEEVVDAAKMAEAHDFIARLPDGYNTLVGPHGMRLSGGERQRLAIARAALRNPRILILDEATSSLDNITEARIQRALERLMENRTTLAISHRWTTLRHCDDIYCVLDTGQTMHVGTYDQLLELADRHGDHLYAHLSEMHGDSTTVS